MRSKILLFSLLMTFGILMAQEPYRSLIISEARPDTHAKAYVEFTNMGDITINLSDFEFGVVTPWTNRVMIGEEIAPLEDWFEVSEDHWMMLPDVDLSPGESFVIASVTDWVDKMAALYPYEYSPGWPDLYPTYREVADYHMHYPEDGAKPPVSDSANAKWTIMDVYHGSYCWYLRHHYTETDSAVIDQVAGVFDSGDGSNGDHAYDVAGVTDATSDRILVRKANITTGNIDFNIGRGVSPEDSEWIPIPKGKEPWPNTQTPQWTIGNHGSYVLDQTTLESDVAEVDWLNNIIHVPWGVQRDDSIRFVFDKKPGFAWEYKYGGDSAYCSARTGDVMTVYVAGDMMQKRDFQIVVDEPTPDANIIMPKKPGPYGRYTSGLWAAWARVTGGSEVDTVMNSNNRYGITFGTRVDSLFKYMEKAPKATWEIDWFDDVERADLRHGDVLQVTAENGDVKEYFIWMEDYVPSNNALLASITWPDIPFEYRGILGWKGDTVPNYASSSFNYKVRIPGDVEGMPALVAKPQDLNATVEVDRASSVVGTVESRTVTFTVTAEDGSTQQVYTVLLEKEQLPQNIQPYSPEPFISEFVVADQWGNGFVEICNPGTVTLDLSDYMFYNGFANNPADAIAEETPFGDRYVKYIPGYKWTGNEAEWDVEWGIAEQEGNVNPIVYPGDVFVMGKIDADKQANIYGNWWIPDQLDIDFKNDPWGEGYTGNAVPDRPTSANFYMFKIVNDSVKLGLKPANDPDDFELVETFGSGDGTTYQPVGEDASSINTFIRKPEYTFPKSGFGESFGATEEESEWNFQDQPYWQEQGYDWRSSLLFITLDIGRHSFTSPTQYMSTVTSLNYIVSPGYSHNETIRGVTTGTTVAGFKGFIDKADQLQTLTLKSGDTELGDADVLADGDSLIVMSADSTNITKYVLEVTAEGLSDDAILTSTEYTIEVDGETGTISGFPYGTTLKTIHNGVTVPAGASLVMIDENDAYVPLNRLNFDTLYVEVTASDQVYFEVTAEDKETQVVYQLLPDSDPGDAFVYSDVYDVDQDLLTIDLIPVGSTVQSVLGNLIPSKGATMELVDKFGIERTIGNIYRDDKIVVTSQDGETTNTYYLTMLGQTQSSLAYLLSDEYEIDQLALTVTIVTGESLTVSDILADIDPAPGATVEVTDSEGFEKTAADPIADGDIFRVTAADGTTTVNYTLDLTITGVEELTNGIRMYPNPSSGKVFIEGLEPGARIQVYNILGETVYNEAVRQSNEVLSLEDQSAGLYFVVIKNRKDVIGRYRLIIK
ncbi:MAG: T9SS type A sorting domain-containing protein [Bacteroidales bacterium]